MSMKIDYSNYTRREEADLAAIHDMRNYLGDEKFGLLVRVTKEPGLTIGKLSFLMEFAGVSGYPSHAFCRRYCLDLYREWMHSGDDAVPTDSKGFPIDSTGNTKEET